MVSTPLYPMVLLIIIPMKNGYFIGNIPYFQTNPYGMSCHKVVIRSAPLRSSWISGPASDQSSRFIKVFPTSTLDSKILPSFKCLVWLKSLCFCQIYESSCIQYNWKGIFKLLCWLHAGRTAAVFFHGDGDLDMSQMLSGDTAIHSPRVDGLLARVASVWSLDSVFCTVFGFLGAAPKQKGFSVSMSPNASITICQWRCSNPFKNFHLCGVRAGAFAKSPSIQW